MLICIKSIPFWRQFEDWNTNFELSTWDPDSRGGVVAKWPNWQRSQSALRPDPHSEFSVPFSYSTLEEKVEFIFCTIFDK